MELRIPQELQFFLFIYFQMNNYVLCFLKIALVFHIEILSIKTSLLKPIRVEAGLGDPPNEFTTNDVESGIFVIKYGLHFDLKNPQEFIERVNEVINTQFRNEDRAVSGKGPYRLRKGFQRYLVDDFQWGQLTAQQRLRKDERQP